MECLSHKEEILGKKSQVLETTTTGKKESHDAMEDILGVKEVDENLSQIQLVQTNLDQCKVTTLANYVIFLFFTYSFNNGKVLSP